MTEISITELYDLYLDAAGRCACDCRALTDEELGYNLVEEFDVGVRSYFDDVNLVKLRQAGYIDDEIVEISKDVRERWLVLLERSWSIEEVRTKNEWQDLFEICRRLKGKLKQA